MNFECDVFQKIKCEITTVNDDSIDNPGQTAWKQLFGFTVNTFFMNSWVVVGQTMTRSY